MLSSRATATAALLRTPLPAIASAATTTAAASMLLRSSARTSLLARPATRIAGVGSASVLRHFSVLSSVRRTGVCRALLLCPTANTSHCRTGAILAQQTSQQQSISLHSNAARFSTAASPAGTAAVSSSTSSSSSGGSGGSAGAEEGTGPDLNGDPLGNDWGVSNWLFVCSGVVFGMVVLGGLTRLTKSGLSMVEWKPASFLPPLNEKDWNEEFAKYQQYPEYKRVNNQMSLSDFKFIYAMEFSHRLLGRSLGILFAGPLLYFAAKGRINRALLPRLGLAFAAGGAQGAVGWWMVRSGLEEATLHNSAHTATVHVSPYRLATHLLSAFAIYALLFSTALRVRSSTFKAPLRANAQRDLEALKSFFSAGPVKRLQGLAKATTALVGLTVASGAFVAGNEAGLVYNEFPLMGGSLWPSDMRNPYLHPPWRNVFENSTAVQWHHRVLAVSTATLALTTCAFTLRLGRSGGMQQLLAQSTHSAERFARMRQAALLLGGAVTLQVSLGISTLLLHVPVSLATAHQAGSLALLTSALYLLFTTRNPAARKHAQRMLELYAKKMASATPKKL